jgi:hypothetical protein
MRKIKSSVSGRMKFIHLTTVVLIILLLSDSAAIFAQAGSVNFSGTWSFNEAKSSQVEGGFRFAPSLITITQDGINLTAENTRKNQNGEDVKSTSKYTLDGKECSNVAFGNSTRKSVLTWSADGKTLLFAHTMNFERDGATQEFKSTESWKLNDDKTLSVETVMNFQGEERKTANVYDKK